jgi:thiamine biosynthesis protein ThiI
VTKPNSKSIHKSEEHLAEKIDELVRTALETVEVITIG